MPKARPVGKCFLLGSSCRAWRNADAARCIGQGECLPSTHCGLRRAHYYLCMMYPPSLPEEVKKRAFLAPNGELGLLPSDARSFLNACKRDQVEVLGWELWIADHEWDFDTNYPTPARGVWCGGIPIQGQSLPAVVHGEGDAEESAKQLAVLDFDAEIQPTWQPQVRVNFTLAE